jgi:hypothetical protein
MLKTIVIGLRNAINEGKDETLKCHKCVVHEHCFEGKAPLILTESNLLPIRDSTGQSSDTKDEMKLCELVWLCNLIWV